MPLSLPVRPSLEHVSVDVSKAGRSQATDTADVKTLSRAAGSGRTVKNITSCCLLLRFCSSTLMTGIGLMNYTSIKSQFDQTSTKPWCGSAALKLQMFNKYSSKRVLDQFHFSSRLNHIYHIRDYITLFSKFMNEGCSHVYTHESHLVRLDEIIELCYVRSCTGKKFWDRIISFLYLLENLNSSHLGCCSDTSRSFHSVMKVSVPNGLFDQTHCFVYRSWVTVETWQTASKCTHVVCT